MANSDLPLFSGYVHGTDGEKQQRLENLNAITNESFIEYLGLRATSPSVIRLRPRVSRRTDRGAFPRRVPQRNRAV